MTVPEETEESNGEKIEFIIKIINNNYHTVLLYGIKIRDFQYYSYFT